MDEYDASSARRSRTSAARSSRARSRSRERAQEMSAMLGDHDAALAEAERKAAAAKERRRARSKSRERSSALEERIGGTSTGRSAERTSGMDGSNSVRSARRDRARSRSRERVNELEKEIEEAEAKAAAAKERRRARSRSRERTMDLERALDEDDNAAAAANRSVRSAARSRARSRSRERAAELAKELERDDATGAGHGGRTGGRAADVSASDERRQRARSRSKERVSAFEQRIKEREERQRLQQEAAKSRSRITPSDARSRGGDTHASEEYDKFNADAELPKRLPMLEPSAKGDKPASQLNIYNSMGAISAISDVSDSATEDMTDTSAAAADHHHGRSSGVRGGSLASRGSSSRAGGGGRAGAAGSAGGSGGAEQFSPNLPPNLHTSLAKCDWPAFHRALQHLSQSPSLIIPSVSMTDPENPNDSTTPLHTACWKAPPTLALMLIRLLPSSRELSGIFTARDGDDNTALHLCCANLERMADGDSGGASGGVNTSVLEALVRAAPRALKMQNAEGDTPLQMLVSSPACLPKTWNLSPDSREYDAAGSSSERVLNLLLNAGGGEEATIMKDMTGATPLHVAIAAGAHGRVIDALIAAAPQALKMPDNRGMLPLHYVAAFCHTPMASVKRMLEIYGDALYAHTTNGDTPLHLLVSNSSNVVQAKGNEGGDDSKDEGPKLDKNMVRIAEALMGPADGGRSPLIMTNREKLTPLHCCALFDAPPRLSQLLMSHPAAKEASAMANSFGATPLHLASAQPGVAQSIATVLAVGTPEAAAVKDRLKRTPLHVASQNVHATPNLIKALAQLHPQATAEKTQRGHLPLHLAAQSQAKETVIKALIKAYPKATQAKNKSSNTPLHDAAKYRASVGAVKLLLDTYPDAVYIQNQYGNLPIHCACAYQAPKDVVSLLLGAYPKGASTQNRNRDTPIHYTAAYATDPATVDPLIDAAPGALLLVNSSGQTPVDRAKANNAPKEIVALLEERAAEAEVSGAGRAMQEDSWGEGEFDKARPFR